MKICIPLNFKIMKWCDTISYSCNIQSMNYILLSLSIIYVCCHTMQMTPRYSNRNKTAVFTVKTEIVYVFQ